MVVLSRQRGRRIETGACSLAQACPDLCLLHACPSHSARLGLQCLKHLCPRTPTYSHIDSYSTTSLLCILPCHARERTQIPAGAYDETMDNALQLLLSSSDQSESDTAVSIPRPRSACCCGNPDCAYLKHHQSALDGLERDVRTAGRLGQVRGSSFLLTVTRDGCIFAPTSFTTRRPWRNRLACLHVCLSASHVIITTCILGPAASGCIMLPDVSIFTIRKRCGGNVSADVLSPGTPSTPRELRYRIRERAPGYGTPN